MSYLGIPQEFRAYQENEYKATGSESNVGGVITIPIICSPTSLLTKDGVILRRGTQWRINATSQYAELINGTTAPANTMFGSINLSTFKFNDTYSKTETYSKAQVDALLGSKSSDGTSKQLTGTAAQRWGVNLDSRDVLFVDTNITDSVMQPYGLGGNRLIYSEDMTNAIWVRTNQPAPVSVTQPSQFSAASKFTITQANSSVTQTVNVTAGSTYIFSVLVRLDAGTISGFVRATWKNVSNTTIGNTDTPMSTFSPVLGQYQWIQLQCIAPANATTVTLSLPYAGADINNAYTVVAAQFEEVPANATSAGVYQKTVATAITLTDNFVGHRCAGLINLPNNPKMGDWVEIHDAGRNAGNYWIGVVVGGNTMSTINNVFDDVAINVTGAGVRFIASADGKWITPNNIY